MALSGGWPTINTFRGLGKKRKIFFREQQYWKSQPCLDFCRPVAALWNFTCVTPGSGNAHMDTWVFHCPHKVCVSSASPPCVSIRESGTALRMHLAPRIALRSAPPQIIKNSDQRALRSRAVISVLRQDRETYLQSSKRSGEYRLLMNTRLFDMDSERCEVRWLWGWALAWWPRCAAVRSWV